MRLKIKSKLKLFTIILLGLTALLSLVGCKEPIPTSLEIDSNVTRIEVIEGENLDLNGISFFAIYNDGSREEIDKSLLNLSGFDSSIEFLSNDPVKQTLTFTYEGLTKTIDIYIVPKPIEKVMVLSGSGKTRYIIGEEFSLDGFELFINYKSGELEQLPLKLENINNLDSLDLTNNMFTSEKTHELAISYRGVLAENNVTISVSKKTYQEEQLEVISNETVIDPTLSYETLDMPSVSKIELTQLSNGEYRIIESFEGSYTEDVESIPWQKSNVFTNLKPNQEYTIFARQAESETYKEGQNYKLVIKTKPLETPTPKVLSYGYNFIEVEKVKYVKYSINRYSEIVEGSNSIKFTKLDPNQEYQITSKYHFIEEERGQIISKQISQIIKEVDNPFIELSNQSYIYNNEEFIYKTDVLPEFSDSGNIISYITYNDSLEKPINVGTYQVKIKHIFSPNILKAGTLTINKRNITLKVNDQEKDYYEIDPNNSFTVIGQLANNHDNSVFNVNYLRRSGENVDKYQINMQATNPNYQITVEPGFLTINKAKIYAKVNDLEKTYGQATTQNPSYEWIGEEPKFYENHDTTFIARHTYEDPTIITNPNKSSGIYQDQISLDITNNSYEVIVINKGTITINPRNINVKIDSQVKTYGQVDPVFTYSLGSEEGSRQNLNLKLSRKPGNNVGVYDILVTSYNDQNYTINVESNTLTINKANITFKVNDYEISYEDNYLQKASLSLTNGQLLLGDTIEDFEIIYDSISISNVGNYQVSATISNPNYNIDVTNGNLLVKPRLVTVIPNYYQEKTYGELDPVFEYSVVGKQSPEELNVILSREFGEDVGVYNFILSSKDNANYELKLEPRTFNIKPKLVNVVPTLTSKVYGDTNIPITYEIEDLVNQSDLDNITGSLQRVSGENVGSYPILIGTLKLPNYQLNLVNSNFAITPKEIEINYNLNSSYTYGDNIDLTKASSSLQTGEYIILQGYNHIVGNYRLTPVIKNSFGQTITSNYNIINSSYELEINKAELKVKPLITNKVYSDNDPNFRYQIESGLKYNDRSTVLTGNLSRDIGEDVGNYPFNTSNLLADNYYVTLTTTDFVITPKEVSITYENTYTYNQNIQDILINSPISNDITVVTTPSEFKDAGTYELEFQNSNLNYNLSITTGTATINKKKIDVNVNNATRKRDEPNPSFSVDLSFIESLDENVDLNDLVFSTTATESSGYGSYPITVESGFTSLNYEFNYINGWLYITHPDFDFIIKPDYVYNGYEQPLILNIFDESGNDITDTFSINITYQNNEVPKDVGTYQASITLNNGSGDIILNYEQVISKRTITINYNVGATLEYGEAYSTNQATSQDLISTHRIQLNTINEDVGMKLITPLIYNENNVEVTSQYHIVNNSHQFEITKALLTIKPLVTSKVFGDTEPSLEYNATGFKKGQTKSVISGLLLRELGEDVDEYLFDLSNLSALNYYFQLDEETQVFTINKKQIEINYNLPTEITFGDILIENPTSLDLRVGDYIKFDNYLTNAGDSSITALIYNEENEEITNNYHITNPNYLLTINQKVLTITPDSLSKVYGDSDPELTYTTSGYVGTDNNLISGYLSRVEGEVVGSYLITINSLVSDSNNYKLELDDVLFEITKKPISFTFNQDEFIYNGQNQIIIPVSDNLVSGDSVIINNTPIISAGTYDLDITINKGLLDVTTSYDIDYQSLNIVVKPKLIDEIEWSYVNNKALATSVDLEVGDIFEYINNENIIPGKHIATIIPNSNYIFQDENDMKYTYTYIGTIDEQLNVQEVVYNYNNQKYDISYLIDLGYDVTEIDNDYYKDANVYEVTLKLSKEYHFDKVLTTNFIINPKEVSATYLYEETYNFQDINYLDNSKVIVNESSPEFSYTVVNYKLQNDNAILTNEFKYVGKYAVYYNINNTNFKTVENNFFIINIIQTQIDVFASNQLLVEGKEHDTPTSHALFEKALTITYSLDDNQQPDTSVSGVVSGIKTATISSIKLNGQDVTNQFSINPTTYLYTEISKNYLKLLDYNKDDLERDIDNKFGNGYLEATKNPTVGFGYRYSNFYYSNKFENGSLNPLYETFTSTYSYHYGNLNNAVIYVGGLINLDSQEFENIKVLGDNLELVGVKTIDLNTLDVESSARTTMLGLEISFTDVGQQTIVIAYSKYGQTIELAKLNVTILDGFTNVSTYEELFNENNISVQNVILNNGIVYKQTLGGTIVVNQNSTLIGNNYEINSYSASYSDSDKPMIGGRALLINSGTIDNVRIIQRRVEYYAPTSNNRTINGDFAVQFHNGVIKNSFIANGRETVEITSSTENLLIENSTILGGPFGIRRRTAGKLTLDDVIIIQRPDIDVYLKNLPEDGNGKSYGGMGIPIAFVNNVGFDILALDIENTELVMTGNTKIIGFETLENFQNATLPVGVKDLVGGIMKDLWEEFEEELIYTRGGETVMNAAILFVSPIDLNPKLQANNPITGFAEVYQTAYKEVSVIKAYGYVYTYNKVEQIETEPGVFVPRYSQAFVESERLFNPPSYHMFTGEYKGD